MKRIFNNYIFLVMLASALMSGTGSANAQIAETQIEIVPATARGCQRNTINIANLSALLGSTKERAFVIARLGAGETSRDLNRRRLNDIKTEFGQSASVAFERIVFAEGNKVKGPGAGGVLSGQ